MENRQPEFAPKRLYRSLTNRAIGGVCGGLGEYMNVDPVVLRVIWLISLFLGGVGLIAYILAWILIPIAPGREGERVSPGVSLSTLIGAVLIIIAVLWFFNRFGWHMIFAVPWSWIVPGILVTVGLVLLLKPSKGTASAAKKTGEPDTEAGEAGEEDKTSGEKTNRETADMSGKAAEAEAAGQYPFLTRSRSDRILFGVCGGIAKKYNLDPTAVRLLWALVTILGLGILILVYIIMALIVPEEN